MGVLPLRSFCLCCLVYLMWNQCCCTAFVRHSRHFIRPISPFFGGRPRRTSSLSTTETETLTWETFDYGTSPKWDSRFDTNSQTVIASNEEQDLEALGRQEAAKDRETVRKINQETDAWQRLSSSLVQQATSVLYPFVKQERIERIESVLKKRTRHTRFLYENPTNPSNVWACLRTVESFGIQHVDVIIQSGRYKGKAALSQKRGMRTAMGSAQWLTLRNHASTLEALQALQQQEPGIRIYASDVNPKAKDIRNIEWNDHHPVCIVMGNEDSGISDEMRALADETFSLPMTGFAESFNLSVATAITLAYLSAASQEVGRGPLRPGDLPQWEYDCLLLKGLINSVPQKRMAKALLSKAGIALPPEINLL